MGFETFAMMFYDDPAFLQEMLDFCAKHNITPEIELITPDQVNMAYERVVKSDVRYRFVIDMEQL